MHVLSIIHYPVFGGPHNRNASVVPGLRERGYRTTVLLPAEPGNAAEYLTARGVDVLATPLRRVRATPDPRVQASFALAFRSDVRRLRGVIRRERIDVVLVNGLHNPHGALAAHLEGVPVVWQLLDTYSPMALRRVLMPVVRSMADAVMTTGLAVAREHPGAIGLGDRLVPFFPIADSRRFVNGPEQRAAARGELGLAATDMVVGIVGNINPMKGHDTFIRAAAALRARRPEVRFVILGAQSEQHTAYTRGLWAEAERLGLRIGANVIVVDPGRRVDRLAPALDIFWLTSNPRSEGIPTVIGEAMALELPVVASDVGSVSEAVAQGETGYVVAPREPAAFAAATVGLVDDADLRARLGAAGRLRAEELFSAEACVERHVTAFERARRHRVERARRRTA
jgi:glycosyltransferase involved in cell wall biosynthesis